VDAFQLVHLVKDIRKLGEKLTSFEKEIDEVQKKASVIESQLGGLTALEKANDFMKRIEEQRNGLGEVQKELEILNEVAEELDGYGSDEEEEAFIECLISGCQELANAQRRGLRTCDEEEAQVKRVQRFIQDKKQRQGAFDRETLREVSEEVGKLDAEISRGDRGVRDLQEEVDKFAQRLRETDLEEKLRRRMEECEEIEAGLLEVQELADEVMKEVQEDMKNCQKNPNDNKEIIRNLN